MPRYLPPFDPTVGRTAVTADPLAPLLVWALHECEDPDYCDCGLAVAIAEARARLAQVSDELVRLRADLVRLTAENEAR